MSDPIEAAGGVLERMTSEGLVVAVIRRTRYRHTDGAVGDWVLPKGKVEAGEKLEDAALREVEEETGCSAEIATGRYELGYFVEGAPKRVTFFRMKVAGEGGPLDETEVAELTWLSPAEAIDRLTYETERQVLRDAYPGVVPARSNSGGRP